MPKMDLASEGTPPMVLSSAAALGDQDLEKFHVLVNDPSSGTRDTIKEYRGVVTMTPKPTPKARVKRLERHAVWSRPLPVMPVWYECVAINRCHVVSTVLMVISAPGEFSYWKFLYVVTQKPIYIAVSPVFAQD